MSKEKSLHFLLFLRSTTKKQPPWDAETDCMSVQLRPPGSFLFSITGHLPRKNNARAHFTRVICWPAQHRLFIPLTILALLSVGSRKRRV